jgi:hypothetical protein
VEWQAVRELAAKTCDRLWKSDLQRSTIVDHDVRTRRGWTFELVERGASREYSRVGEHEARELGVTLSPSVKLSKSSNAGTAGNMTTVDTNATANKPKVFTNLTSPGKCASTPLVV